MHPHDTGHQYDAIASLWDEKRRTSQYGTTFLERAIALCGARNRALDVGCGSGGPMIEKLIAAGFKVTGVDVSIAMLEIAKAKYPTVEFFHDDITQFKTLLRFDLILAWDSIFHLPRGLHVPVIEKLCGFLTEGGVLLFSAGGIDTEIVGTMHGHEFHYSSLSDTTLLELIKRGGCVPVLMGRDQYPLHHLVIIGVKAGESAA
jgi:SAM-dependent methyltransferase